MTSSRRDVLGGVTVIGAGVALGACGDSRGTAPTATTEPDPPASTDPGFDSRSPVAKTGDVPVGSGLIVAAAKAVITQPKSGEFRAFSSVCTHKGCAVTKVSGDTISCPCHGSQFSTADGSVRKGPATDPLALRSVTVKGGELFLT
ncbi:MAG TPA: Rieske 2Fe-2S domain-containing protein [Aeromicrobium sp.]|nr:Rieske 2Fe-2S domain-containing protein [Aeromicrobium sp.]